MVRGLTSPFTTLLSVPFGSDEAAKALATSRADAACAVDPEPTEIVPGRTIRCFHPEIDLIA